MTIEQPLAGGMGSAGQVVRVGDTVRRPPGPASAPVRALLLHLEAVGFDGAPRHLGTDELGRDVLSYVDGEAAHPPYPAAYMTDEALASVARLLADFHQASATLDRTALAGWATGFADPEGGPVVCHDDVSPENVVFCDGRAVALIDFDLAAPGRPLWDVARAAQQWAPLMAPGARPGYPEGLDATARFGRFTRAYGLDPEQADELLALVAAVRRVTLRHVRDELARGHPRLEEHWRESRGEERAAADGAWLARHRAALVWAAARRPP
ncbi:MAG TPA: phosphotransferase [Acidimicrobiales bacterium]|nr:phosphotransferase [Acidimicrobiales bacterium]